MSYVSQYLNDSKKNLLLAPDEIAKLLNKHTLSKVLSSPRKAIDAEEYVLKREKAQDDAVREGLKVCACDMKQLWQQLSPLAQRVAGVFSFLLCTFGLLVQLDQAFFAGAVGAVSILTLLFFIVMKRDQKWAHKDVGGTMAGRREAKRLLRMNMKKKQ